MSRNRQGRWSKRWGLLLVALAALAFVTCRHVAPRAQRRGQEIVVAGVLIDVGAPVVLWSDPGGYNAYRTETSSITPASTAPQRPPGAAEGARGAGGAGGTGSATQPVPRYGLRGDTLSADDLRRVQERGWDLPLLRGTVDQLVFHYDATGTSRDCFRILHDKRGLSCHFLVDLDGTIYQTLDLQERAWHATTSNNRSIGIEIANIGAAGKGKAEVLAQWYRRDATGTRIAVPPGLGDGGVRTAGFVPRPARDEPVAGRIQGQDLVQYDFTPEQYRSLIHLTATLCRVFPAIRCDYPRDSVGKLVPHKLPDAEFARYRGLLGHYHVQTNKVDPGPAFQWDLVVDAARRLMTR